MADLCERGRLRATCPGPGATYLHTTPGTAALAALCCNYTCRFPQSGWEWCGGMADASAGLCPGLRVAQLLYLTQLAPPWVMTPFQGSVVPVYGPPPKPGTLNLSLYTLILPLLGRADEPQMAFPASHLLTASHSSRTHHLHCKPQMCTVLYKKTCPHPAHSCLSTFQIDTHSSP